MNNVSRALLTVALVAAFASLVVTAGLAATVPTMPGGIAVDVSQVTVKVVDVNHTARSVTLEMPSGKTITHRVGKEVRNFAQVKKGDVIKATLVESLAVFIEKKGGRPAATETQTVILAPRTAKPGVIVANTYRITGKIQMVDLRNRMVTITGPNYMSKTVKVGPNVKNLKNLKAGDDVVVRYTEALAIDVVKSKK